MMQYQRAAVFIDKDGTLVEDLPHNVDPSRLSFMPGAMQALQELQRAGFALVVVTNQPGLAWGRFSRAEFAQLSLALTERLGDEAGVQLAGVYVCPHAPNAHGAPTCLCRKPAPGLLRQAALGLGLHLQRSWIVGDILDDVEAGHRVGTRTVLFDVGHETEWRCSPLRRPHYRCADWLEVAHVIVDEPYIGPSADRLNPFTLRSKHGAEDFDTLSPNGDRANPSIRIQAGAS